VYVIGDVSPPSSFGWAAYWSGQRTGRPAVALHATAVARPPRPPALTSPSANLAAYPRHISLDFSYTLLCCPLCSFGNRDGSVKIATGCGLQDWGSALCKTNRKGNSMATCWRNLVPTFADRRVSRGQRGGPLTVVNLSFLHRSRYFSFK
jgi:hypothetical protein